MDAARYYERHLIERSRPPAVLNNTLWFIQWCKFAPLDAIKREHAVLEQQIAQAHDRHVAKPRWWELV